MNEKKSQEFSQGIWVLIGLAALTAIEYGVAQADGFGLALSVVALIKAAIIVNYFMHIARAWNAEEPHE